MTTATILIGHAHQNHSGINPTHLIRFTENDRPALILQSLENNEKPLAERMPLQMSFKLSHFANWQNSIVTKWDQASLPYNAC
jgi:hypothetical protein